MAARIPVHVVTGVAGMRELIARLCAARADWIGLVGTQPQTPSPNVRTMAAGCPCCTGKVVLQVSLVRALRESRATRAFVEMTDPLHVAMLEKLFTASPLGLSVVLARRIVLPQDGALGPEDLEKA